MALTRPRYSNIVDGDFKNSCRAVTTTDITLEGGAPQTYDGVTFVAGDRILVAAQNNGYENGIYAVLTPGNGSNGTWRRSYDANSGNRLSAGAQTAVSEGTFGGSIYRMVTPDPIVVGVTAQVWVSGTVAAGGANHQVQFNDFGVLSGTANLLYHTPSGNITISTPVTSTSTTDAALIVKGGVGIGDGLYVNGITYVQNASSPNVLITGGSITGTSGAYTTLEVGNFSSANIYQSAADTFVATNLSTGNARFTGGSITGTTGAFTKLQVDNFSSGNIYQSAADTFVATNLSTGNAQISGGMIYIDNFSTGNIYQSAANYLVVTNLSTGNLYQSAADTFVSTNFSSGNIRVTGGSATGITGYATTLRVDNFNSGNIYQSAADYLVVTNLSSGNIYQSAADTFVSTNFSSGNIRVTGGSATGITGHATTLRVDNLNTGNLYQSAADTLVATNFSSANARIANGYADNFPIGANTRATGAFTTISSYGDSFIYANLTVTGNLILSGPGTSIVSDNMTILDSMIDMHTFGNLQPLTVDDGRDIGIKFHYFKNGTDSVAFAGWANDSGYFEYYDSGAEGVGNVFVGSTYGKIKAGSAWFSNSTPAINTTQAALRVSGGVGIADGLYVNGTTYLQNYSSPNVLVTGGSITGVTGYATTLRVDNLNSGNIYQSAADYLVVTNLSSGNIYQSAAGTLVATNFSSGNIYQSAAGTLVATNFSSGNIYQSAAGTLVATNFSSGNTFITGGAIGVGTNGVTSAVANVYAGMGVITNFGSPNVAITGGYITASGTVQPNANGTVSLGGTSSYWNNLYAVTAYHNTVIVGAGGVTTTDGNLTATSAITGTGNVVISGNIYQGGVVKHAIQYTPAATPHTNPQVGDQWYDTVNDTLYEYTDDGTNRFWLDMTGKAVPVTYTSASTAPSAPKAGDMWYDTSSSVLYTRVYDGANNYWVDYSSQSATSVTSVTSIIQPANGGTGVSTLPYGLLRGNGTEPVTAAVSGVDYIAPQANNVLTSTGIAGVDIAIENIATISTVQAGYIYFDQYLQGTNGTFDALTVAGNATIGNINLNYDLVATGNITANNLITGVNLVYSGNVSYDGNLNVADVFATNVRLGQWPGVTYIDGTNTLATYADTETVDFANFSGTIIVTSATSGVTAMYLCGGNSATAVGASKIGVGYGVIAYNAAINGYTWTNNSGDSLDVSFMATKTRNSA